MAGLSRKVFAGVNPPPISYTGTYTTSEVERDGEKYTLWTLTTSGTLTIGEGDPVEVWCCGGGTNGYGGNASNQTGCGGNGGYTANGTLTSGQYAITIGTGSYSIYAKDEAKAGGTTRIGSTMQASGGQPRKGGSGGGINFYQCSTMTGQGTSTIPFGIESLYPHCAGGGAGAKAVSASSSGTVDCYIGGSGGTNGGSGASYGSRKTANSVNGGAGGNRGGGSGGRCYYTANSSSSAGERGNDATFYGSAGGGSGNAVGNEYGKPGGTGYQGVAYLLVPA